MKTITLTLFSLLLFGFSYAQKAEDTPKKPDILFNENIIDFGTIKEGEKAKVEFKFHNAGNAPLVIKAVRPSCGCTTEDYPKEPIMPGASGIITASFNSKGYGGKNITKTLRVTTNIQENGTDKVIVLSFKGEVQK